MLESDHERKVDAIQTAPAKPAPSAITLSSVLAASFAAAVKPARNARGTPLEQNESRREQDVHIAIRAVVCCIVG